MQGVGQPASQASSDDGSSPLVPILIAIVALAAVSLGALWMRARRQGRDSGAASVTPKVG